MRRARRTVAVFSPKGGVGTTTIATNIAIAAAAAPAGPGRPRRPRAPVRRRGDAPQPRAQADARRRRPRRGRAARARAAADVRDAPRQRAARPRRAGRARGGRDASRRRTSARSSGPLLEGYDLVVIDAGSTLDERALAIFEAAETVILPVTPEIAALKAMHALLEYLSEAGSVALKSTFVLNNLFAREILKLRDVESVLGHEDRGRAAVRPVPLPQGGQRGRADRHRAPRSRRPPSASSS